MNKLFNIGLLESAKESADCTIETIQMLHSGADDQFLAEHAFDLIKAQAEINQKITRLLTIARG